MEHLTYSRTYPGHPWLSGKGSWLQPLSTSSCLFESRSGLKLSCGRSSWWPAMCQWFSSYGEIFRYSYVWSLPPPVKAWSFHMTLKVWVRSTKNPKINKQEPIQFLNYFWTVHKSVQECSRTYIYQDILKYSPSTI